MSVAGRVGPLETVTDQAPAADTHATGVLSLTDDFGISATTAMATLPTESAAASA